MKRIASDMRVRAYSIFAGNVNFIHFVSFALLTYRRLCDDDICKHILLFADISLDRLIRTLGAFSSTIMFNNHKIFMHVFLIFCYIQSDFSYFIFIYLLSLSLYLSLSSAASIVGIRFILFVIFIFGRFIFVPICINTTTSIINSTG